MASRVDETFRALLQGDLEDYAGQTAALDEPGWNAFGELVGSAFHRAVGTRFLPGTAEGDITSFVASAAEPFAGTPVEVDQAAATALVQSALGDTSTVGSVLERFDEPDLARIELVLLRKLVSEEGLQGDALERFLDETRTDARPWTGEPHTGEVPVNEGDAAEPAAVELDAPEPAEPKSS